MSKVLLVTRDGASVAIAVVVRVRDEMLRRTGLSDLLKTRSITHW
jgi:hypothetical protein